MVEQYLSKKGIAKLLSISTRQIDRLKVPYSRIGRVKRYLPSEVIMFFKEKENNK